MLRSVDLVQIPRFLKEFHRYELAVAAKQAELPSLSVLPYTASIDLSLLKSPYFMGKFHAIAVGAASAPALTNENIKIYIIARFPLFGYQSRSCYHQEGSGGIFYA